MAGLPLRRNPGAFWDVITASAESRRNFVQMRQAVLVAAFEATGEQVSFPHDQLTSLFQQAIRNREAAIRFAAAPATEEIRAEHIGAIPNAPAGPGPSGSRRFLVQFEHNINRAGEITSIWRTSVFDYGIPATKQSMINRINRDAANLAEEYENELHLGVGSMRILAA